jgi:hypothetical protein
MAIALFDENIPHEGSEFFPFDDSRSSIVKRAAEASQTTSNERTNTTEIDQYRQGVEITSETYRHKGAGPKIWSGNILGYTLVRTLGQAVSFTEFENSKLWEEFPKFNPVSYLILGENYPSPIEFNEGPQQNKEANMQPLTIPFRDGLQTNEFEYAHAIRGNLEDGNPDFRFLNGSNSRISQFIDMNESNDYSAFLDGGVQYYGSTLQGSIVIPGYLSDGVGGIITPYDDCGNENIINKLNIQDTNFLSVIRSSCSIDLDDDIRGEFGYKSSTAGYDVYGPNQSQYGTDSLAFLGQYRGS